MIIPLETSFRGIEKTDTIENLIQEKVDKLERYCGHISRCCIAVESRHQHQRSGRPVRVRIDIKIPPGDEVVVSRNSSGGDLHEELPLVLRNAFEAADRKLKAIAEKQGGETKRHAQQETGAFVSRICRDEGYGFLRELGGREIYFHRNSVLRDDFERLEVGTGVRFVEVQGEKGPQASTVQIVDKAGARVKYAE